MSTVNYYFLHNLSLTDKVTTLCLEKSNSLNIAQIFHIKSTMHHQLVTKLTNFS